MYYSNKSKSTTKRETGQSLLEYILVLAVIAVIVISVISLGKAQIGNVFSQLSWSFTMESEDTEVTEIEASNEEDKELYSQNSIIDNISKRSDSEKLLIGMLFFFFFVIPVTGLFASFFGKIIMKSLSALSRLLW